MNNKELPEGRQTFRTTTPSPPVREKELAPPPTAEEVRAANAGELAPRGITKKLLNAAKNHPVITAGATLATIAGGFAAAEAYQGNIPGIHRSVDQGSSFDNTAKEPKFTDKNSSYVSLDQFKSMDTKSSYDPATQTFTYVLPFAVPEGVTIDYNKLNFRDSGIVAIGPDTPFYHEEVQFLDKDGKPEAGVSVIVPDDGWHVTVSKGSVDLGQDPNYAGAIALLKYFLEQDVSAQIIISDPSTSLQSSVRMMDLRERRELRDNGEFKDTSKLDKIPAHSKGTIVATTTDKTTQPLIQTVYIYEGKSINLDERKLIQNVSPNLSTTILNQVILVKNK